jgi:hypothetical protein
MLDLIVDRREIKAAIGRALRFMGQQPVEIAAAAAAQPEARVEAGT